MSTQIPNIEQFYTSLKALPFLKIIMNFLKRGKIRAPQV